MAIDRSKRRRNHYDDSGSTTLVVGGVGMALGSLFVVFVGFMLAHLCLIILQPECATKQYTGEGATAITAATATTTNTTIAPASIPSPFSTNSKPELVLGATSAIASVSEEATKFKPAVSPFPAKAKFPPNCTSEQLDVVSEQLPPAGCLKRENKPWIYWDCSFANKTYCGNANPHWFFDFIHQSKNVDETFRGIIVGCNKGYEALELLRIVSPPSRNKTYDWKQWRDTFSGNATDDLTAEIDLSVDCPINGKATSNTRASATKNVHVYCIDAMPNTIDRLNRTKQELGYGDELDIVKMVVSDQVISQGIPVLVTDMIGSMAVGPYHWKRKCKKNADSDCVNVFQGSIDHLVESKPALRATTTDAETGLNTSPLIQFLSITAETSDYDVLKGAAKNLGRIQYIDFSYDWNANWTYKDLKDLIFRLKKKGFVCYFTGSNGEDMWRITDCWLDHYGLKFPASIGCTNANIPEAEPLLERMEGMFLKTLNKAN